ncbi:MAG: SGNH/GDSL hydrolase family protein [Pseudomonadota bacterium]|nr:SGNH/GDSL hydrolase family protein [Pseudomonadota bacterium]
MDNAAAHIVLLGDSIFDNAAYVPGEPAVVAQLRSLPPSGSQATLLAVDGAVTSGVARQLTRLPSDATRLVVSAGGNDALGESHLLRQPGRNVGEGLAMLREAQQRFARSYEQMVSAVLDTKVPAALCTIYDANHPAPEGDIIKAALSLFNDVITRAAFMRGLPVIDLRLICSEASEYANPIEPSAKGGDKIAQAIADLVGKSSSRLSMVVS